MVFTFDIHTRAIKVACYVITHSNYSETKFYPVIKFDQWNAPLVLRHDKQASALWPVYSL